MAHAVEFYRKNVVNHDLLQDRAMQDVDTALSANDDTASIASIQLDAEIRAHLESVANIYRDHWWPAHNAANRFWIAVASPLVQQFGTVLVDETSRAFDAKWPPRPIRVDVVEYANWAGAYTFGTANVHTFISSFDHFNQGFASLEVLFHEASHAFVDDERGPVADAIAASCKANNTGIPRRLWHALIFFTAGELIRWNLERVGVQDYKPYADASGLYTRVGWNRYESALQLFWIPHLDGKLSLDSAIASTISALALTQER